MSQMVSHLDCFIRRPANDSRIIKLNTGDALGVPFKGAHGATTFQPVVSQPKSLRKDLFPL